jgi:hypothetical protein
MSRRPQTLTDMGQATRTRCLGRRHFLLALVGALRNAEFVPPTSPRAVDRLTRVDVTRWLVGS